MMQQASATSSVSAKNVNVIVHMCNLMAQSNEGETIVCMNSKKQSAFWYRPVGSLKMPMDLIGFVHEMHDVVVNKAVEPLEVKLFSDGISPRKWTLVMRSERLPDFWHIQSFEAGKKTWLHITRVASFENHKKDKQALEKMLKNLGLL